MASVFELIDSQGRELAQVNVTDIEDGWYYGKLSNESFSAELRKALDWYDEVVTSQMLSLVDEALAAIEEFQLRVCNSDGTHLPVFSLHASKDNSVCFRTTPVPAPRTAD